MGNTKTSNRGNKAFANLCRLDQKGVKAYLAQELYKRGREIICGDGYLFSAGDFPVLLCAHMDTVHKELPAEINVENGIMSSPQGIGGDDRCGVYMILQIIKKVNCPVVFFEDEEIGGVGSEKFASSEIISKVNVNYVIELDRMNGNDAVFYDLDNPDFEEFITREFWKVNWGSFTDICNICPALGVAGVNLSCGYYKQHTKEEYVVLSEMRKATKEVIKLLQRTETDLVFEWHEYERPKSVYEYLYGNKNNNYAYRDGYAYGYDDGYGDYYGNGFVDEEYEVMYHENGEEKLEYAYGPTYAEAVLDFFMSHGNICFNDIIYFVKNE